MSAVWGYHGTRSCGSDRSRRRLDWPWRPASRSRLSRLAFPHCQRGLPPDAPAKRLGIGVHDRLQMRENIGLRACGSTAGSHNRSAHHIPADHESVGTMHDEGLHMRAARLSPEPEASQGVCALLFAPPVLLGPRETPGSRHVVARSWVPSRVASGPMADGPFFRVLAGHRHSLARWLGPDLRRPSWTGVSLSRSLTERSESDTACKPIQRMRHLRTVSTLTPSSLAISAGLFPSAAPILVSPGVAGYAVFVWFRPFVPLFSASLFPPLLPESYFCRNVLVRALTTDASCISNRLSPPISRLSHVCWCDSMDWMAQAPRFLNGS